MTRIHRTKRPSRRSGFTIIEAVVLISVIGILASVAAPRFLAMSEMDIVRAHRQALSDLRFAQRLSATSGCPVQVDFEPGGYVLTQRTACRTGPFSLPLVDPVANTTPYAVALPYGVAVNSSVDPLIFDALGRTTSSSGTVVTASIGIGDRSLEAIGETGYVRVP